MGGSRTTRTITNSTIRPIRTIRSKPGLRHRSRSPAKQGCRTPRHVPTLQMTRASVRTRPNARARATPGLRVARDEAGPAKAKAEITDKAAVVRGIVAGGAGGARAISSRAAPIGRTADAKTMVVTTTSTWPDRTTDPTSCSGSWKCRAAAPASFAGVRLAIRPVTKISTSGRRSSRNSGFERVTSSRGPWAENPRAERARPSRTWHSST